MQTTNHQLDPITNYLIIQHLRRVSRILAKQAAEAEGLLESSRRLDDIANILSRRLGATGGGD